MKYSKNNMKEMKHMTCYYYGDMPVLFKLLLDLVWKGGVGVMVVVAATWHIDDGYGNE